MIVRYRAEALADIAEIYSYIRERSPDGAENVLRAIYAGVQLIGEWPQGSPRTDNPDIRVKLLTRYRYRIFYRVTDDEVFILHVRHTSRRPWP